MDIFRRSLAAGLTACMMLASLSAGANPEVGTEAPDFTLMDQHGDTHTLTDYRGRWVALYFYPKDDTPGCTTEACAFRDDIFKFKAMDVAVIGVSLDDVKSHAEFAEKYHLPFTLLSDADARAAKAYGVLKNFGLVKVAGRHTFLIGPDGNIARHYKKVDPETHSAEVLADITKLMAKSPAAES